MAASAIPRRSGIPSLRARIARHYGDTYDLALDPARVVVTTGSSGGFILAFLALFEAGDRVALANPGYPPYRHILSALGCEPVLIETSAETRWALSAKALIAAHRQAPLKGVVIASPANPTGTMMDADALARLIAVAEAEGIRVISDEIYHGLDYAFAAETAAKLSERAVVINSFSKYFCMTGWRIGWMVVPETLVRTDRAAAGQSRDLGADAGADRGARPPSTAAPRWKRSSTATRRTAAFSPKACRKPGSTNSCRSTARSISTPTSRASPTTAWISPSAC